MSDSRAWVESATILRVQVGSGAHGIAQAGTDDHDEMGVCLEPLRHAVGLQDQFEQHIMRTAAIREGRHDAPSQAGDTDRTIYSLRKWCRLALKGNPTALTLLFSSNVLESNALGHALRHDYAYAFASRQAGAQFMGYLQAQRMRILGERGQKNVNRRDLVEKHGYDTKYAGHMLRLGYQGVEFMESGRFTMPMREHERLRVLAVRAGQVDLNDVLSETGELEAKLRDLRNTSPLPERPDTEAVESWMTERYLEWWKSATKYRYYGPIVREGERGKGSTAESPSE